MNHIHNTYFAHLPNAELKALQALDTYKTSHETNPTKQGSTQNKKSQRLGPYI